MAPMAETVEVDRAAAEVFAYATDPSRFHEWQKGVTAGHLAEPVNKCETPVGQRHQMAIGVSSGRLIQKALGSRGAWGGLRNRPGMAA